MLEGVLNIPYSIMTSQGLTPARNAGLSSHHPGNNSKWPLSKFSRAMTNKTSIPRGIKEVKSLHVRSII